MFFLKRSWPCNFPPNKRGRQKNKNNMQQQLQTNKRLLKYILARKIRRNARRNYYNKIFHSQRSFSFPAAAFQVLWPIISSKNLYCLKPGWILATSRTQRNKTFRRFFTDGFSFATSYLSVTLRLLLPGSLKTGQSDHSRIRTVNNSKFVGFNCCFPSTRDWFNQLWLKFIVLVLQSDWPVLFK